MAAFYITDISGQPFESYSALSNTTSSDMYCGGKQWTPQRNDYCIVREDETQTGEGLGLPTSRYIYNPGATQESVDYNPLNWEFQYTINDSGFTQEQLNAINSGISRDKVTKLDGLPNSVELNNEFKSKVGRNEDLSSINDNQISNYIKHGEESDPIFKDWKNNSETITIGKHDDTGTGRNIGQRCIGIGMYSGSELSTSEDNVSIGNQTRIYYGAKKCVAIGTQSGIYTTNGYGNVAIGDKSRVMGSSNRSMAIGFNADISSADDCCQIGWGVNTQPNSLQFLSTMVVDSEGRIPNSSLELKSVNGILSSDGNGNIVSAEISTEDNFERWLSADGTHIGMNAKNTGDRSIAIGNNSNSTSYDSIACGSVAEAKANYSIAIGNQSKAFKFKSIAIGNNVIADGEHSIAIGNDIDQSTKTQAKADFAIQIGVGVNSNPNTFNVFEKTILDYDADTSSHYIPNDILELASTNGVLSSDGNGHIVSANISIDHLSSIGDNEISGYVRQDATTIVIGDQQGTTVNKGENGIAIGSVVESGIKPTYKNNVVIGHYSYMEDYGSNNVIIGVQSKVAKGYRNIAVGNFAQISGDITDSCQIGSGVNTQVSSLQFLETTVVNSNG